MATLRPTRSCRRGGSGGKRHPQATFDEIDEEVWRQFADVQAWVVEALSQPEPAPADTGEPAAGSAEPPLRCAQCQTAMQRRGQRHRRVPTRQGQAVLLRRAYYVCPACGAGRFPLDEALGLGGGRSSPQVLSWLARLGRPCRLSKRRRSCRS